MSKLSHMDIFTSFRLRYFLRRNASRLILIFCDWKNVWETYFRINKAIKLGKFQIVLDNFLLFAFFAVVISLLKLYTWPSHSSFLFLLSIVASRMSVMCMSERMDDITKLLKAFIHWSSTYDSIPAEFGGQFLELVWNIYPLWTRSFRLLYFSRRFLVMKRGFSGIFNA